MMDAGLASASSVQIQMYYVEFPMRNEPTPRGDHKEDEIHFHFRLRSPRLLRFLIRAICASQVPGSDSQSPPRVCCSDGRGLRAYIHTTPFHPLDFAMLTDGPKPASRLLTPQPWNHSSSSPSRSQPTHPPPPQAHAHLPYSIPEARAKIPTRPPRESPIPAAVPNPLTPHPINIPQHQRMMALCTPHTMRSDAPSDPPLGRVFFPWYSAVHLALAGVGWRSRGG
ncbi:hypothetical protein K505DRAFT_1124 [Melanomma pulvis-pyrius CBS 109.77]|uniref:Uncharacterized protein n=1 Tax=Melanomma pulvis-pyrius CBS 109.77 TaxID=1314802 RepID=A0A6A6XWR5_9PLEO|nr:hypothetical protein K505DRAFT_1124 [Melanomma pulvis-pyrius CBS 109.77]